MSYCKNIGGDNLPLSFSTRLWKASSLIVAVSAVVLVITEMFLRDGKALLVAIGLLSVLASSLPLLIKARFHPFEPIVLFAFTVFMGTALGSIVLVLADSGDYKAYFLTDGMSFLEITRDGIWVPISLLFFSVGYLVIGSKRIALERLALFRRVHWRSGTLLTVVVAMAAVSTAAVLFLAKTTDVDYTDLSQLSVKRAVELDSGDGFARLGYLRWLADLAKLGLFLILAHRLSGFRAKRRGKALVKGAYGVLVVSLVGLSVWWPIVSSSRTGILEVGFGIAILWTCLGLEGTIGQQRRRFFGLATVGVVSAIAILVSVGVWRQYSQKGEIVDTTFGAAVVNNTVASGNFLSLDRTALIIDRMSDRSDWQFGMSYLNTFFAPIPRTLWPEKPELGLGLFVKRELYGRPTYTNGYPAGLLGEAFINFGVTGLLVIPFLAGAMLKILFNSFKKLLDMRNKNAVVIYALILWPIGFQLGTLDFTLVLINTLIAALPGVLALYFVSSRRKETIHWEPRITRAFA